ncbi:hypothetical protein Tco_0702156 [Tanacetum coccineum]|uniref:Uncharacterized protein n=1 Tax=Tanacetum coccineum TaxID=301880 RepID=A0ABQ4XV65_9ASTR
MVGDLVDKGVASIVTSSEMISIHCLSSLVSLSSSTFSFLELSCYRASPSLFEMLSYSISASAFLELSFTNSVFISTKVFTIFIALLNNAAEATILTTTAPDSTTLTSIHQRVSDLEKEVKILKDINHDSIILAAIKSKVPTTVKECLGTNFDDTLKKVMKKHLTKFIQQHSIPAAAISDDINKQLDS